MFEPQAELFGGWGFGGWDSGGGEGGVDLYHTLIQIEVFDLGRRVYMLPPTFHLPNNTANFF